MLKPNDSLIVICNVFDPDADTLVYDWYTSGVVKIKGLPSWGAACFIYSQFVAAPQDTFWIQYVVRDGKGWGVLN